MKKLYLFLGTSFYSGYAPIASGTFGTIPGFIFVYAIVGLALPFQILSMCAMILGGVYICNQILPEFNSKDPSQITIDEMWTLPITFFAVDPLLLNWKVLLIGFLLHRILDIIKPFPAFQLQALPKGWGIMIDDVISSIYSCLILHILLRTFSL